MLLRCRRLLCPHLRTAVYGVEPIKVRNQRSHGRELISLRVTLREDEPNTINDLLPIINVIIN
jgi:hypothetical protein